MRCGSAQDRTMSQTQICSEEFNWFILDLIYFVKQGLYSSSRNSFWTWSTSLMGNYTRRLLRNILQNLGVQMVLKPLQSQILTQTPSTVSLRACTACQWGRHSTVWKSRVGIHENLYRPRFNTIAALSRGDKKTLPCLACHVTAAWSSSTQVNSQPGLFKHSCKRY